MLMLRKRQSILALVLLILMVFSILSLAVYEPFKTKLGPFDRLVCLGLCPTEGSFLTLKIVREMQMELALSEEEIKLCGLKDDLLTGGVIAEHGWDKVEEKEIVFGDIAKGLIVAALEKLDKEEKLTQQHYVLYVKFIIGEEKEEVKEEVKEGEKEVEIFGGENSYNPNIEKEEGE